ncbi:DUF2332 domain-containing protein [Nocardioides sp.]|uniref:DUF2332 domain-containing protein n=1 Tax=Nocardioides sp. TaxID=35761 RepID=UPI00262D6B69|nr:DUF2332 domain-containing protein [Nocardioides sp.]MDI6910711.1 DUF2332 domain-containing protein [Nocardioides sp.]
MDLFADTATQYAEFAADAAPTSPCFADWSRRVATDEEVLAWLETLPLTKRQPNLVLAAARWHGVPAPGPYAALREALLGDDGTVRRTILERATQTNEAGRLATLVPAFALAAGPGPVALLEVGASAGLCLYPDRYRYAWRTADGVRRCGDPAAPELGCTVLGVGPLPAAPPAVVWRAGIDLSPVDVTDGDQVRWLSALVWPEHDDRRAQLARAVAVARTDPPYLVRGDLVDELPAMVERAREHGPVLVFHSAVIAYLPEERRSAFHELMTGLVAAGRCHWVSNEGPRVLPAVTETGPEVPEDEHGFVLGVDGRAVARTHGHGRSLRWL